LALDITLHRGSFDGGTAFSVVRTVAGSKAGTGPQPAQNLRTPIKTLAENARFGQGYSSDLPDKGFLSATGVCGKKLL